MTPDDRTTEDTCRWTTPDNTGRLLDDPDDTCWRTTPDDRTTDDTYRKTPDDTGLKPPNLQVIIINRRVSVVYLD